MLVKLSINLRLEMICNSYKRLRDVQLILELLVEQKYLYLF